MRVGILFAGALQDDLDVNLFHRFANFPVHDGPAASVQNAAHVIKRTGEIEVTDVDMPVIVRLQRLHKAGPLLRGFAVPAIHQSGLLEHAVDRSRADGDDVRIEHHEGQPAVAFQWMLLMKFHEARSVRRPVRED